MRPSSYLMLHPQAVPARIAGSAWVVSEVRSTSAAATLTRRHSMPKRSLRPFHRTGWGQYELHQFLPHASYSISCSLTSSSGSYDDWYAHLYHSVSLDRAISESFASKCRSSRPCHLHLTTAKFELEKVIRWRLGQFTITFYCSARISCSADLAISSSLVLVAVAQVFSNDAWSGRKTTGLTWNQPLYCWVAVAL